MAGTGRAVRRRVGGGDERVTLRVLVPVADVNGLRALAERTGVPASERVGQAVDDVFRKYHGLLLGRTGDSTGP